MQGDAAIKKLKEGLSLEDVEKVEEIEKAGWNLASHGKGKFDWQNEELGQGTEMLNEAGVVEQARRIWKGMHPDAPEDPVEELPAEPTVELDEQQNDSERIKMVASAFLASEEAKHLLDRIDKADLLGSSLVKPKQLWRAACDREAKRCSIDVFDFQGAVEELQEAAAVQEEASDESAPEAVGEGEDAPTEAAPEPTVPSIERVDPKTLNTSGGTQPRAELSEATIDEYAKAMKRGDKFPPAVVFCDGEDYWLAAGFHRQAAAIKAEQELLVEIRQGTQRDAILFSVGENATHGLRRTNADKRRAVETLLRDEEWSKWSDRKIATQCGVSHVFVGTVRGELSGNGFQMETTRTVTRGKSTYQVSTAKIGKVSLRKPLAESEDLEATASPKPQDTVKPEIVETMPDALLVSEGYEMQVHAAEPIADTSPSAEEPIPATLESLLSNRMLTLTGVWNIPGLEGKVSIAFSLDEDPHGERKMLLDASEFVLPDRLAHAITEEIEADKPSSKVRKISRGKRAVVGRSIRSNGSAQQ